MNLSLEVQMQLCSVTVHRKCNSKIQAYMVCHKCRDGPSYLKIIQAALSGSKQYEHKSDRKWHLHHVAKVTTFGQSDKGHDRSLKVVKGADQHIGCFSSLWYALHKALTLWLLSHSRAGTPH